MKNNSSEHSVEKDNFDKGIVPAEMAARKAREGDSDKNPEDNSEQGSLTPLQVQRYGFSPLILPAAKCHRDK